MNNFLALKRTFSKFFLYNIPFFSSFLIIILSLLPWQIPFVSYYALPCVYIAIFYWIIFAPDFITPLPVFLLGFFCDCFTNVPLGYNTMLFLLFYWFVLKNRRFLIGRSFLFLWGCFCISACVLATFQWAFASLLLLSWLSLAFFFIQEILLMLMFPMIAGICAFFYSRYLDEVFG